MLAALGGLLMSGRRAQATTYDFIRIASPDTAYQAATTKIPITAGDASGVLGLADARLSLSFSTLSVITPPLAAETVGTSWSTWSSPPYAESATPRLLYYSDSYISTKSLGITFSQPLQTFGAEIEMASYYATGAVTMTFYDGTSPVGAISQTIGGAYGARLFAAEITGAQFDSVVVSAPTATSGFGIGQFRYEVVPEPAGLPLAGVGAVLGRWGGRRPKRRLPLDSAGFDGKLAV